MITYPKVLRQKDLKKISNYPCDDEIKDAYTKYLTNYSFTEFVEFCEEGDADLENLIFSFTDLQLEKFEPNSLIWVSHVLINFLIYFDVNLDYGNDYDAYASALQFTVLFFAMNLLVEKISFDEVDNLGLYVEIEVKKYNYENEKEIELLIDLIKELDINMSDIETKRYPELMQKID